MSNSQQVLQYGAREVTQKELSKVPTPAPTSTYFPIAHSTCVSTVQRTLTEAGFAWEDMPLPDGELRRRAAAAFPPGDYEYLSEIGLQDEALVRTLARSLEVGVAFFIDYGFPEREYYHAQRAMGTLRCHYRHLLSGPGDLLTRRRRRQSRRNAS